MSRKLQQSSLVWIGRDTDKWTTFIQSQAGQELQALLKVVERIEKPCFPQFVYNSILGCNEIDCPELLLQFQPKVARVQKEMRASVGAITSHRRAWAQACRKTERGHYAFFIEDDIQLASDSARKIREVFAHCEQQGVWPDMLNFCHGDTPSHNEMIMKAPNLLRLYHTRVKMVPHRFDRGRVSVIHAGIGFKFYAVRVDVLHRWVPYVNARSAFELEYMNEILHRVRRKRKHNTI